MIKNNIYIITKPNKLQLLVFNRVRALNQIPKWRTANVGREKRGS